MSLGHFKSSLFFLLTICFITISSLSYANEEEFEYDEYEAEDINRVCAACHGEFGQGGGGGVYPRLAGLPRKYLVDQMKEFFERKRVNIPMLPFANERELSAEDIFNITTFHSQQKLGTRIPVFPEGTRAIIILNKSKKVVQIPPYPGDIKKGEISYRSDCALCHGKKGQGKKNTPQLVGQFSDYLFTQVEHFKTGARQHEDAEETFAELEADDIKNILAYLATLDD
ncbi:MAG: c-type cytochrome [Alphaproteobacteria bacterium]|nr:c-type cytochrome [Rhodospirillales bacterium]MCW9046057.1 c-type cytochrome [Alphaproteobacteria bacterium]